MIRVDPLQKDLIEKILHFHLGDKDRVFAFGSRATGERLKPQSDLDLCVRGEKALDDALLVRLRDAFTNSDLPFRVDLVDWHRTDEVFQKIIESQSVEICFLNRPSTN